MAKISMRIPRLDRAFRSIGAIVRAPIEAVRASVTEACGAVCKPLSAATRAHLATRNSPKETKS